MKTVRFAEIIEQCGQPEIHLLLVEPEKDVKFQRAIREKRVMTVFQSTRGHKADHAEVVFEAGTKRQFLIFPKSLEQFAGSHIVGIRYELMEADRGSEKIEEASRREIRPVAHHNGPPEYEEAFHLEPHPEKVVLFPSHHRAKIKNEEDDADIAEIKARVRHAMEYLERGEPVAAFNLLKRIVDG